MEVTGKRADSVSEPCKACQIDGRCIQADGYCQDCDENMCQKCFQHHVKGKLCRNHVMSPLGLSMLHGQDKSECNEKCRTHITENIKYYCREHDIITCGDCNVADHQGCKIEFIGNVADQYENSSEFKAIFQQIEQLEIKNNESRTKIDNHRKENKMFLDKALSEIKNFRKELNDYLDRMEKEIVSEANNTYKENDELMSKLEMITSVAQQDLDDIMNNLDSKIIQGEKLFIRTKEYKPKLCKVDKDVSYIIKSNILKRFAFEQEQMLPEMVRSGMKLGFLRIKTPCGKEDTTTEIQKNQQQTETVKSVYTKKVEKEEVKAKQKYLQTESSRHTVVDQSQSPIKKHVVIGSIAKEEVDVIVNSTNTYVDMNVGAVSQTLLKGGGEQLGLECKTKYPKGINVGEIAVTSGGMMNCQRLFHGVLVKWDDGEGHAEKVMAHFVKKCLDLAHTMKYKSIAFPALGTGMHKFPADVVARLMNDVVDDFGAVYSDTGLKTVKFVIWQGDKATAKAFEDLTVTQRQRRHSIDESKERYSTMAAGNIVEKGGKLMASIGPVKIHVTKDDITQTVVGAIVNITMDDLNLDSGAISNAILKAAGSSIQKEVAARKKTEFNAGGLVVTGPGKLLCQKIIHVRASNGLNGLTKAIRKCLMVTESMRLNSVAFPALVTLDSKLFHADQMAEIMIEAFQNFIKSSKHKRCLKDIHIVIFNNKMLDTFVAVIKDLLDPQWIKSTGVQKLQKTREHWTLGETDWKTNPVERTGNKQVRCSSPRMANNSLSQYFDNKRCDGGDVRIMLPSTWTGMKISDKIKVVPLSQTDPEYLNVYRKLCYPVLGQFVSIERIQNPTLYTQYIGKKRQMEMSNAGGRPVEQQLWYGTRTKQAVDSIIQRGFDRNYNSGFAQCVGGYFTPAIQTSLGYCSPDPYTGQRYIILADVLTGEYCSVSGAFRVPPMRTGSLTYDSTTDNVYSPNNFVIYHDAQAYPTYVITFR